MQQVIEDFDRIASLMAEEPEARETYSDYLLSQVPLDCAHVLDIGCGFGSFARLVSHRARQVTAIDVSPQMISIARERSAGYANLEFALTDFLQTHLPAESYDCVVTLATLHHLPLGESLKRMKALLSPGGVLVVHDLVAAGGTFDRALDFVRLPVSMAWRLRQTGRLRARPEVRKAWIEHGRHGVSFKVGGRALKGEMKKKLSLRNQG
jgi:2-polyprenyl-3-methyl-5-hydroxy-6-metoxy-1,4-benzoquinol methylase